MAVPDRAAMIGGVKSATKEEAHLDAAITILKTTSVEIAREGGRQLVSAFADTDFKDGAADVAQNRW